MDEIIKFNEELTQQRKSTTLMIGALLACGFAASVPLFTDSIKHDETLYCNVQANCRGYNIKKGISFLIDRERRNQIFDENIKVVKILPPEDPKAINFGLCASLFISAAYGVSKALTDKQEEAIHSQFKLLKIKAIETDIIEQNHIELFGFSRQNQSEIVRQSIARGTAQAINSMKSPGEMQLDHLNGTLQGELSFKNHELLLSQMNKEIADNRLSVTETTRKIDKALKPAKDSKEPMADEELKNILIEALKAHEDGWMWFIIGALKPLWLIGNAGSGKTTTAAAIALVRKYCLDSPVYYLIDRHATGENSEKWKLLGAQNKAETEADISSAMEDNMKYWADRIKQIPKDRTQIIIDEYTSLKTLIGEVADIWFRLHLSDCRKAKNNLIGITHNATNSSFPVGTEDTRKAGMILIEKFSANGETPLNRVVIRLGLVDGQGNNLKDAEKTIPAWFHPQKIHDHFNGKLLNFED